MVKSEWESSLFGATVGSPRDPLGRKLSDVTGGERTADLPKVTVARSVESDIPQPRPRVYITKAIMDKVGPTTAGCKRCAGALSYNHSEACRARVEALMAADPAFQKLLERDQKKQEECMATRAKCQLRGMAAASETPRIACHTERR